MTSLVLAQATAPTAEFIGMVVLSLILLTRWLWDYNKNRREEAAQHEPKATPALHLTYATKVEHKELADRVDAELGRERSSRKKMHEELASMQAALAAVQTQNETQSRDLADVKKQVAETNTRVDAVPMRTIQLLRETQQYHKQT